MPQGSAVFIVDDDPAVRDSLSAMLDAHGYRMKAFETAAAFLEFCDQGTDGCLLLDVRMPDINGLEFQKQLKAEGIGLPVIIMTGHGDIRMAVDAIRAGAADFIEKPFTKETILESVENALRSNRVAPQQTQAGKDGQDRIGRLTPREMDVFRQLVIGNSNKVIAYELDISPRTVEIHRARVMEKMQARNLSELVRMAIAAGIDPDKSNENQVGD